MSKGILVHPEELSVKWIDRAANAGIDTLGIHPVGGYIAPESLRGLVKMLDDSRFCGLLRYARKRGLTIEYEMHSAGYLLPRELFETHPEYFRMDENGVRTPDRNLCVTNETALDIVAQNAALLAKLLIEKGKSSHRFYFWQDDVSGKRCNCSSCRKLSPSDLQLTFLNRIITELRCQIPDATLSYIAYLDTIDLPQKVKPAEGIFLEYAPIEKYRAENYDAVLAGKEREMLAPLLDYFGRDNAKILEYYLDNSLFSGWKKPPKKLSADRDSIQNDMKFYRGHGVNEIATFACYLGDDYEALYGEPDITPFTKAYDNIF